MTDAPPPRADAPQVDPALDAVLALRRTDFWAALALIAAALFFLWRTTALPFLEVSGVGVAQGHWFDSAALAPYVIFTTLFALAVALLVNAVRAGGAPEFAQTLAALRATALRPDSRRVAAAMAMILAYVFALVPRVDFVIASALTLTAMIYGFHVRRERALGLALAAVLAPALYALVVRYPQSEWATPHDDDWVALVAFLALAVGLRLEARAAAGSVDRVLRAAPWVAMLAPLTIVCAMAFGFRQNVPNRTGLIFQQIEYQWFVTVKPWLTGDGG